MQRLTLALLAAAVAVFPAAAQEATRSRTEPQDRAEMRKLMIENRINNRLAQSGSLAGGDIGVTVNGGDVVLNGTVADQQTKERAARIARRVGGVENVQNNLRIDRTAIDKFRNVRVPDDQLSRQIAEKLVSQHFAETAKVERDWMFGWEVEGEGWEFEIDVDDGDVLLKGDVPRPGLIAEIIRTARSVPGVRRVTSELRTDTYRSGGYYDEGYYDWPYYWGYHPYPYY